MRACLLLGLLFLHTVASADSPFLSPSLNVSPKAPSQSDALALDFLDQTGVHANVLETSISRSGQFIEVRASIELGHVNVLGSYEIHHSLQPLTSGIYQVAFVARTKRKDPDTEFTEYFTEGEWKLIVIDLAQTTMAVEFHHTGFDHYFLTANADEIAALDTGYFSGWSRTGQSIRAIAPGPSLPGTAPVCRFYGRPEAGLDTHVYTAHETECGILAAQPQAWIFENPAAFAIAPIDVAGGSCPINTIPVYRLWNGLAAPNHRYTTSKAIQAQMAAAGWVPEGSGTPPAIWCALPSEP